MTQGNQSGSIKAPQTRAEFDGLYARRGELREQLRSLEERRTQLSAQSSVSEPQQRGALAQRIATIDERIPRVERELLQLDDAIAKSAGQMSQLPPTGFVGGAPVPPDASQLAPPGVMVIPDGSHSAMASAVTSVMLYEAIGFVLVGLFVWRYTLKRFEERILGKGTDPGHVARLQQSVDSIAVEVERISENQRYVTKLLGEKGSDAGARGPNA